MAPNLCRDDGPCTWAPEPFRQLEGLTIRSKWNGKVTSPASNASTSTVGSDPLADVLHWLEKKTLQETDAIPQDTVAGFDEEFRNSRATEDDDCNDDLFLGDTGEDPVRLQDARAQPPRGSCGQVDSRAIARPGRILQPAGAATTKSGECAGEKPSCSASSVKDGCLAGGKVLGNDKSVEDEEEKEWEYRRRLTGTVCRLVRYCQGANPREDVTLRGGYGRHVVVAEVKEGGTAGRMGIRAGDRLVSIDGSKDFQNLSADAILQEYQKGPTVLVFVGFIGQLQAEVRLNVADESLGISNRQDVLQGSFSAPLQLCEERVFNTSAAPLFLSVGFEETARPLFELRRADAYRLVKNALSQESVQHILANRASGMAVDGVAIGKPLVEAKPAMPRLNLQRWSRNDAKSDTGDQSHEV
mmetsp:Transcript_77191/g.153055  ORF Transcript_77191/g.153055 Transcript_77191/m.153055 type:complete len:414 (-) Transcript_77191:33-1274(-)